MFHQHANYSSGDSIPSDAQVLPNILTVKRTPTRTQNPYNAKYMAWYSYNGSGSSSQSRPSSLNCHTPPLLSSATVTLVTPTHRYTVIVTAVFASGTLRRCVTRQRDRNDICSTVLTPSIFLTQLLRSTFILSLPHHSFLTYQNT